MEVEIWKPVLGYEGFYEVSNLGRMKTLRRGGFILKPNNRAGYLGVTLAINNKVRYTTVHRVVLESFVSPRPNGLEVAHLNGNRHDCRLSNLKWVTRRENMSHKNIHGTQPRGSKHRGSKLKDEHIPVIFRDYKLGVSSASLAKRYGVCASTIVRVLNGKNWCHLSNPRQFSSINSLNDEGVL